MRILFVTPFYAPEWKFGGPPRKISGLAKALNERGHDVRVVTFHSERPNDSSQATIDSSVVQYLPWFGNGRWPIPKRLRVLRDLIVDASLVHCFGLYNFICPAAARLAVRLGKPYVVEPMGMFVPRVRRFFLKRIYNGFITSRMFDQAEAVVATSDLEANEIRSGTPVPNVVVRPNGVTLDPLADPSAPARLRKQWGVTNDGKLIGYIGRISAKKRLIDLVDAFGKLESNWAKLLIAGPVSEHSYAGELEKVIRSSPRSADIVRHGLLEGDDYVAALNALDLFVLPSENENFGNSAAEAVLAEVPVLITHTCGVAPKIEGRAGMVIELGTEPLRQGLEYMLRPENPALWQPNWARVKEELSWADPVRVMEGIYQRASGAA